jgi:creatinine amidohydrolase/Fe(II)-dependent formamide hydrolase-like protein
MSTATCTRLEDLSWPEFESRAPHVPYWILVTGSVEQHGPHLPLGSDTLVVERLAEVSAARHGALVLGAIRVGVLHAFQDWPGTQRVPAELFGGQVRAMAEVALRYSNRLLILNGHDENQESLVVSARHLVEQHGTDVVIVEWAHLVNDVIREVASSKSEAHAGEALTSLLLHWYPERVRTDRIAPGVVSDGGLTRDDAHVTRQACAVPRFRRADVPTGVIGDPTPATAEKGAVIADALVRRVDQLAHEREWL